VVDSRAVNAADSEGNTALHIAAQQGMLECMKILLRNGANVEAGVCLCLCLHGWVGVVGIFYVPTFCETWYSLLRVDPFKLLGNLFITQDYTVVL